MFRAIISPILGALDSVYSIGYKAPMTLPAGDLIVVTSRQHRRRFIPQDVNTV